MYKNGDDSVDTIQSIQQKYGFKWEVLDVLIGGKSIIDTQEGLAGFNIATPEEADRFIRSYGYNLSDPIEQAESKGIVQESVNFIRRYFLKPDNPDGLELEIPRKILEITDIRDLLLMASFSYPNQSADSQGTYLKNWACAVLKIVHVIAHTDKDTRAIYFSEIQKQILDRFYKVVHRDEAGQLFLGEKLDDPLNVPLVLFETKPKKSRDSILIKLLHKTESVAEDIFDTVGIRFVTKSTLEALRVIKYLKDKMVVMPANIKPSRSRNTLVDIPRFNQSLEHAFELVRKGELHPSQFSAALDQEILRPGADHSNPHSSRYYRSIQFTGRQLIKLRNPLYQKLKELKSTARSEILPSNVAALIEQLELQFIKREIRFFYPFEIQVSDQASHEENERGLGAHKDYKKAQVQTAMKRVMWTFINGS